VIVPCYNEADGIPQLKEKLPPVLEQIRSQRECQLILIDDGSTDNTFDLLTQTFADVPNAKVVRHPQNMNLGAAIRTGFHESNGEWIAYLDSDCTYEPQILQTMIREMEQGNDLVTVSPYHPKGEVIGVPAYRLFLSKSLSFVYRLILRKQLYTYTAMVRTYRRSIFQNITSPANDFTAVAEMLLKACAQNLKVVEIPAALSVRRFGESKMKTARVIRAHLKLISRLIFKRSTFLP
jgi:dolichol-phosphate mannosyltransferase